jgi:cell division protease FtsH
MVTRYGMSDLGPVVFGEKEEMIFLGKDIHEKRNYSEKTAERIDDEINRLVDGAMKKARAILEEEKSSLDKIVKHLLEHETIEKEAFEAMFKDAPAKA